MGFANHYNRWMTRLGKLDAKVKAYENHAFEIMGKIEDGLYNSQEEIRIDLEKMIAEADEKSKLFEYEVSEVGSKGVV